ncbi:MAG: ATP-binding protein, partial [Phaeodactylibacter sp.]|nr:ATP-binding protein [Phaeodactylibacter sp.]
QQDFRKLRTSGALYIDKTEAIHRLVTEGDYYFLSRPRRFGKSLTLSVIRELFEGSRELFEGLWVEQYWDWQRRHPVVHIAFNEMDYKHQSLHEALKKTLRREARNREVELEGQSAPELFKSLLVQLSEKHGRVALLIDEYDKPLIDYLDKENISQALENQQTLKSFYSIIKSSDAYIHFLLITGVSKFSKVGVFSDLNNLLDISLHPRYSTLAGITEQELESYFGPAIDEHEAATGQRGLRQRIKEWYNGYSFFNGGQKVYNPFSLLSFFSGWDFQNFWFASGTPTFLVRLLRERNVVQLDKIRLDAVAFNSYDLERLETYALLFQTGYLTIKSLDEFRIYTLGYPNLEVEESMMRHLFSEFRHEEVGASGPTVIDLRQALYANDLPRAMEVLDTVFQAIPHQLFLQKREAYFHSLIYLAFRLLGIYTQAEVNTARGRLDCIVHTPTHIYLFEFKLDQSAEAALKQIRSRGYADAYRQSGREVVAVGVNFSSEQKAVEAWTAERMEA